MKIRNCIALILVLAFAGQAAAQPLSRPKLVVGIVIDQMRWDYLYRFYDRYGKDGFRRMINEGFSCENTLVPYTPTYTAAGHTCVYTGSVPALHGIMGNNWYDRLQHRIVYCTEDNSVQSVGSNSVAGKMSPRNLWSSTITDELRLATNFRNKTISIAMKDRGSILPGGHASNGSFWFDNASGGWITSSFYMQDLPGWMKKLNDRHLPEVLMKQDWTTLYPAASYVQSTMDSNLYEGRMPGEDFLFPHRLDTIGASKYEAFRTSPQGVTYTFEAAKAAVEGEQLGARDITDFLALSFSSPDYIGHTFGPNSVELEDAYLRLDKDLGNFFQYLDARLGKGQYLVFLTADHAAAQNPSFLRDHKLPTGNFNSASMRRQLSDTLTKTFNTSGLITEWMNYQIYLNDSLMRKNNLDVAAVKRFITEFLMKQPAVANVVDLANLSSQTLQPQVKMMLTNGYNQKLSGNIQIILRPQWFESQLTGTTHGAWNPYDAHIPLLWYGWKIKPGKTNREVYMTDIAPTLAGLLHVQMPSACIGKAIDEVGK